MLVAIVIIMKNYVHKSNLLVGKQQLDFDEFSIPIKDIKRVKVYTYEIPRIHLKLNTNKTLIIQALSQWNQKSWQDIFEIAEEIEKSQHTTLAINNAGSSL